MDSTKKKARIAGVLYTLVALSAPIGLIYAPGKLFVAGDATATAERIRSSVGLVHVAIASELFHQGIEVFLVLVLYALFKSVSQPLARQMAILGFIPIPIMFLNVLNESAALMLASGAKFLGAFDKPQQDALATLFLSLHTVGFQIASIFWGLWLFPLGMLIIRCGFIPRLLAYPVMAAGVGYLLGAAASLVLPRSLGAVGSLAAILEIGEPPIIFWLLIWGARVRPAAAAATA